MVEKPGFKLVKTQDFNNNFKVEDPEKKRIRDNFKKVMSVYNFDLNKSPFLI